MTSLDNDARRPRTKRSGRRTGMLLLAGAALAALPIVSPAVSQAETSPVSQAQTPPVFPPPHWIIQENALRSLGNPHLAGHLSQRQLQELFGNKRTYIDYGPAGGTHTVTGAISVYPASSEAALKTVLASGKLPRGTNAVLFDIERWKWTPLNEQQNPNLYMAKAARDVHHYNTQAGHQHLLFIAAPAPDLTTSALPGYRGGNYPGYLKLQLAFHAAQVSDVLDIQGQQIQNDLSHFTQFVNAAAAQAHKANPHVIILVGLTTTPKQPISAHQLIQAYCAERALNGYWLNIAAGTDKLALPLLRQVLADNGNGCPSGG